MRSVRTRIQAMVDAALINQIEQIRVENNRHWMDLVRLAVSAKPRKAKAILRLIAAGDGEVRRLTQELAK